MKEKTERILDFYKTLHQLPESGLCEIETSKYILETLSKIPELKISKVSKTGILAFLKGTINTIIGFRADMDGLPLIEKTDLPYRSKHKGMMHACGHDGHMAILLEFIFEIVKIKKRPDILFIFQPAEEGPGGAEIIFKSKEFKEHLPDKIFGLHVFPGLEAGKAGCCYGPFMAGTREFNLKIIGKEAHAASNTEKNALLAGTELINNVKIRINKEIHAEHIFHFGQFLSGIKANVVASNALITGTMRAFDENTLNNMMLIFDEEIKSICKKRNLLYELEYPSAYPVLINHKKETEYVKCSIEDSGLSFQELKKFYFGEDFAYFLKNIPGAFFFLGVNDNECQGSLHTDNFCFDPHHLEKGVKIFHSLIKKFSV